MEHGQKISALELALTNELNEREFYLRHAERTRNDLGRTMFRQLADDEAEHYARLKDLHENWSRKGAWPETVDAGLKQAAIRQTMQDLIAKTTSAQEADRDDLDALKVASAFEVKGMEAYGALARDMTDARGKAFFELLASMEREHYLAIKDMEEYLLDPQAWHARHERHGLDGA
jgi:rubrerythrin